MDFLWDKITEWLKEMLVGGIVSNLSGMFDATNQKVAEISGQVGLSPQAWNGSIFSMIQNLSETVIVPIAGAILAFVMTLELIQLITDKNNLNDMDTWIFFKWAFKSAAAVLIVTNTWAIVMGVFDAAQSVVASASGLIIGDTSIDISSVMVGIEDRLMEMELGPLFGLWFQSLFVGITMWALTICIFIITFGRMIEIYLVTSVAPIPMATMMGKEWGGMGQNYIRSLLALGFQAFLIIVCVAIYAVLVQNIALVDDIIYAIWTCISDIIDYTENPQKTDGGRLITSWQCDSRIADAEFLFTKNQYIQKTGRVRGEDDVIAYHLRQSFVPGEITPEDANRLGCELAKRFTKGNHAYIVCTHIDKAHIHNHVIWNSTALSQTRKFRNFWGSSRAVRRLNDTICIENGYSIVENPKRHGKSYNKWLGDKKKPSHRERICAAIDDALAQNPDSFEALLELLRQAGYEVKGKKVPSLLGGEQKKSIRMDTLGDGYTPTDLRAVIAGEKTHTPRKSAAAPVKLEKRSGNLLVDIQAKLRAGKGAGYARWATLFNLKQMAQTVAYLQDHELLDYAVLSEKAAAASAHFNELSARIKAAEKRMAEIAVLREHIVGYAKTRDTYVAYRKAGYSKKFLAEHESEITIHKAAKNYFDGLGFKKLPTIKALNTEYAELLAEKKAAYADYRKAREEMKELLTAKANIDRILELDKEQEEANERREKEAEQR